MAGPDARIRSTLSAAAAARNRGDTGEEARILDRALADHPAEPHLLNARGMRALADQDPATALECFSAATQADPAQPPLWVNIAGAHRALGDDAGERAALERALELDRGNFLANFRLAELHQRQGRDSDAAQSWAGVLQLASAIQSLPPAMAEAIERGRAFLKAHNQRIADTLDSEIGPGLAAAPGAARRFQACVDHALGRRRIYHNECAGIHFPFLPADEFFDRGHFPWLADLEAKTPAIRAEALALLEKGSESIRPYVRQDSGTPRNKWTALDHSLDWSACFLWEYGERNDPVCDLCPETAAALAAIPQSHIPGKAPSAFFSILKPRAHIPAHTGVTNTRTILHLPLVVPDGCRFRVGGETRAWKEGEAFAFDDTIDHEAWNDSDATRIVLIFDVWNPHLTPDEQQWLTQFLSITDRM